MMNLVNSGTSATTDVRLPSKTLLAPPVDSDQLLHQEVVKGVNLRKGIRGDQGKEGPEGKRGPQGPPGDKGPDGDYPADLSADTLECDTDFTLIFRNHLI